MTLAGLDRVGVKIYCERGDDVPLVDFIPIFHRWIQQKLLPAALIDVADYSHVPHGPGIILVAHEGIWGMDETGGRRGMVFYRRRAGEVLPAVPTGDGAAASGHLAAAARCTLLACTQLAREPEMKERIAFRGDELLVFANDRLLAPNTDATWEAFQPVLAGLLEHLYPGARCTLTREPDPQERFGVAVKAPKAAPVETLLERLET